MRAAASASPCAPLQSSLQSSPQFSKTGRPEALVWGNGCDCTGTAPALHVQTALTVPATMNPVVRSTRHRRGGEELAVPIAAVVALKIACIRWLRLPLFGRLECCSKACDVVPEPQLCPRT